MATIWIANYPLSSTIMSSSTEQIRYNWDAIEDWWDVEHQNMTSAGSGAHSIGEVGAVLVDATSGISALSSPGTGALALNTTLGELQMYRYDSTNSSAGWDGITDQTFARMRKGFGVQTIPASTWTKAICAATSFYGAYDTLSAWSNYKYTIPGTGYYFVVARITWGAASTDFNKGVAIYKNGAAISRTKRYGTSILSISVSDIIYLAAADYIEVYAWHNHTSAVDIAGGSLQIVRVS